MAKAIAREGPQDRQLQGQDRGRDTNPHATQPPQILRFLVVSTGAISLRRAGAEQAQARQVQAWLRLLPPWPGCTLKEGLSTGSKAIN